MTAHGPGCQHDHPERKSLPSIDPVRLERAARLFRAMGDPARLRTLHLLSEQEWCVTEIVETLQEKFSTVSQRLRLLRTEGLVRRRRDGNHIFYALADDHVADLMRNGLAHADELNAPPVSVPQASGSPGAAGQPVEEDDE